MGQNKFHVICNHNQNSKSLLVNISGQNISIWIFHLQLSIKMQSLGSNIRHQIDWSYFEILYSHFHFITWMITKQYSRQNMKLSSIPLFPLETFQCTVWRAEGPYTSSWDMINYSVWNSSKVNCSHQQGGRTWATIIIDMKYKMWISMLKDRLWA